MKTIVNFNNFKDIMKKLSLEGGTVSIENLSVETLNGENIEYTDDFNVLYKLNYRGGSVYLYEDVIDMEYEEDKDEFVSEIIKGNEYIIYTMNSLDEPENTFLSHKECMDVYPINELFGNSKEKAIYDIIIDWITDRKYNKDFKGSFEQAIDKSKENYEEEFICEYIYKYCLDEIIDFSIKNNYTFDEWGIRVL